MPTTYYIAQTPGWGQEGFPVAAKILAAMSGAELRATGVVEATGC